ncbi:MULTISPECIES: phytanoyl-CoA dioxygenase family protein [Myxococcus]|nr:MULTISPECIES: phytanoyl-CoA dioxygenase family protein [Myxococcus]NOJ56427.1 phytanoyl-CoA dioxygenase [Myxococcus xanthus]QPM80930.1 phytanoyl-CoA dioxygenase family protein [Myxococcus xanthus]QVW69990.1 phytanoyl-CoA dioxygenase family protein [Myxococcus xanthus DZ2]QZZ48819.1 hypothetical protein MyxoNM_06370 [Myxococcus xanthus]UEO03881.1 phytanoyl-CoA dioxygenase family protein [Myxococcus xanthus DZ2]
MNDPVNTEATAHQTEAFRREGYVVIEQALSDDFLDVLRADFEQALHAKVARFDLKPAPRDARCEANDGVLNDFQPDGGNHDFNRWNMHLPSRRPYFEAMLVDNPRITGVIDQLLGPDWVYYIIASDTPFPNAGFQTAHQDYTRFSIAINIPLVDVTPDNGPMEVWPGTHQPPSEGRLAPFTTGAHRIDEPTLKSLVRRIPSRKLVMRRGAVLIRDHRMVHRGTPNLADAPRYMLSLYCIAAEQVPYRLLSDAGATLALSLRRMGRGSGAAVRHRRLFDLGAVLGRVVEECSLSDRDYRRTFSAELWASLGPRARHHLRFARVQGEDRVRGQGDLKGSGAFLKRYAQSISEALQRPDGRPRLPDHYAEGRPGTDAP